MKTGFHIQDGALQSIEQSTPAAIANGMLSDLKTRMDRMVEAKKTGGQKL